MKCPKCHYLSFDPEPRCRNCGYTLALDPDLEIHGPEAGADAGLADLSLRDADAPAEPPAAATPEAAPKARPVRRTPAPTPPSEPRPSSLSRPGPFDAFTVGPSDASVPADSATDVPSMRDSVAHAEPPAARTPPPPPRPAVTPPIRRPTPVVPPTTELPLFVKGIADEDASGAAGSRIADRAGRESAVRQTPAAAEPPSATPRRQPRKREAPPEPIGPLDRDLLEGLRRIEEKARREGLEELDRARVGEPAAAGLRAGAAGVDGLLIGGISIGIVSMTLRWVDLGWGQWMDVPLAPLSLFLLLIVAGYLFLFTAAGGQTVGKMLTGIRVVDAGPSAPRVTARQALTRSLLAIPSVLAFGVGFFPALTGEHLAMHDRLSRTRVVRA